MGRRSSGIKVKKRKKVTVQLLKRVHAGEVTEPYAILEDVLENNHAHLKEAKVGIAWRLGWRINTDGHLKLGQCRKRGDLDRELDGFDFIVLLNKEAWPTLNPKQKRAVIDHELCHAQIVIDSDGQPKKNDRDRLVCRIKGHDTEEFRAVVERHGLWTADLEKLAQAGINDQKRPLLSAPAEEKPKDQPAPSVAQPQADWKKLPLKDLQFTPAVQEFLERAGHRTIGSVTEFMSQHGDFWDRDLKIPGVRKPPNFRASIEDGFAEFWAANPQYR